MKWSIALALLSLSANAAALDVYEALTETGWRNAQRAPDWIQGKTRGGYNHGRDIGYVMPGHHEKHEDPKDCPPVPAPAALYLFGSALAGMILIARRITT